MPFIVFLVLFAHLKGNVCLQCSFKIFLSLTSILFSIHGSVLCIKVDNNCQNSSHACAFLKGNEIKGNGNDIIIIVQIYRYFLFCHVVHNSPPWRTWQKNGFIYFRKFRWYHLLRSIFYKGKNLLQLSINTTLFNNSWIDYDV